MRRRLPTGIQTFRRIREADCYYVDKTPHIERLIDQGAAYFLSRPRRFGKSLLVDTIKELFEGREELFRGLHLHDRWDWSGRHPVLRLDFSGGDFRTADGLAIELADHLGTLEESHGVGSAEGPPGPRFRRLIRSLHQATGERVVVLVDEYDKAVLDPLVAGDRELARSPHQPRCPARAVRQHHRAATPTSGSPSSPGSASSPR